jgi:plasmid stabilization system protein ParE
VDVRLATSALDDLRDLRRYYREQGVPEVGERLIGELFGHIEHLADHPDLGRVVPEFDTANLRELIHPPFRLVYWRETERVHIVRIWRSERLLRLPGK